MTSVRSIVGQIAIGFGMLVGLSLPALAENFSCPKAGVTVQRSKNYEILYRGADPDNPLICVYVANGTPYRFLYGLFSLSNQNDSLGPKRADAFGKVLAGGPGTEASLETLDRLSGDAWEDKFRFEAIEFLNIGGLSREVIRYSIREDHRNGRGTWIWNYLIDRQTGAIVGRRFEHVRGNLLSNQEWTALSVAIPSR